MMYFAAPDDFMFRLRLYMQILIKFTSVHIDFCLKQKICLSSLNCVGGDVSWKLKLKFINLIEKIRIFKF